ncbi:MAG: hypothetical protein NTZ25_01220 [Candidatus Peregrinibacteria bacterium]|nr:hypothetical protein [Candidatus Peregrinibacteria bacterium]
MKDFNFKKMAPDMSFQDKVKLLFADWNLRKGTHGKERLITLQEEKAMIDDIQKKNQIDAYNRLVDLYNMSNFLVLDIQTSILSLKLSMEKIRAQALAIVLHGQSIDQLETLIFTISDSQTKSIKELEKKIKTNTWNGLLSLFQPQDGPESLETREPNHNIQMLFERLVKSTKALLRNLYSSAYIIEKSQIDFLRMEQQELILEAKEQIRYVEELDGLLGILTIYKKHYELGLMRKENFTRPIFLEMMLDYKKVFQLTDEEKSEVEAEIDKYIDEHN